MDKEINTKDKTETKSSNSNHHSYSSNKKLGAIIAVIVAAGFLFWAGLAATFFFVRGHSPLFEGNVIRRDIDVGFRGGMGGMHGFVRGQFNDSESRLTGVVTKVDGKNFTIAGSGSTNDITTNDSTQYTSGSSVSVNDTVVVSGTISGGTFTATQVVINPGKGL